VLELVPGSMWSPKQFCFLGHVMCQVFCYGGISQLTNVLLLFLKMALLPALKILLLWRGGSRRALSEVGRAESGTAAVSGSWGS